MTEPIEHSVSLDRFWSALPESARDIELPRLCYAAAHVALTDGYRDVPHRVDSPGRAEDFAEYIDWDATRRIRTALDGYGLGVAEAMDTAQRFSLGWRNAKALIDAAAEMQLENGFIAGAGYDHVESIEGADELVSAVVYQGRFIADRGGVVIILPMPWLTEKNAPAEVYVDVYGRIVDALKGPVFVHWLGEMFLPALRGYFPGESFFDVLALGPEKIRGAKLSLLDAAFERRARGRLLELDQVVLTGDDFNFSELILGDDQRVVRETAIDVRRVPLGNFSHALLGVLDAVAEPAALALRYLAAGDVETYRELMAPCEVLGRWIFQEPTQYYKAGIAFLAWLNDLQPNPMLINHEERTRSYEYYVETARLAAQAGVLKNSERAAERVAEMRAYLTF